MRAERYNLRGTCAMQTWSIHHQSTETLLKFQHASITLQSRAANDVTRDCRPATVAEQRLRPWKTPQLPLK